MHRPMTEHLPIPTVTFTDATAQLGYLTNLGISHLYLSLILRVVPGSMHVYALINKFT